MGLFSRMKESVKAKANAAVDKMGDPEKQLDLAISELEEMRKQALKELVSYKTTAKQMEHDIEREERRAAEWEKKAMVAVKAGNDALAKQCLRERQSSLAEVEKIKRDRDEAAAYAVQLNKSRKTADAKLRMLKLRKGTLATQLKMASAGGGPLSTNNELFDKFQDAETAIDHDAIEAEVNAALAGEEMDADFEKKLLAAGAEPASAKGAGGDDPLEELKAKMAQDKERKKLTP